MLAFGCAGVSVGVRGPDAAIHCKCSMHRSDLQAKSIWPGRGKWEVCSGNRRAKQAWAHTAAGGKDLRVAVEKRRVQEGDSEQTFGDAQSTKGACEEGGGLSTACN